MNLVESVEKKTISVVAPFYNEEDGIAFFYQELSSVLNRLHPRYDCEIVCVNDGSSDNTLVLLHELSRNSTSISVVVVDLSRNFGKEAALTAGINTAKGDAVIPIDADLQDPPELIMDMVREWEAGYEVVLAKRTDRSSDSYLKRSTAGWFYRTHNKISNPQIPENVGDYRLMDRSVVEALKQLPEHQRFMKGLFAWVGFRTTTLEYARQERSFGHSKFSGWKLWNFAIEGITSFSTAPLKFWTYVGGIGAIFTMSFALYIIFKAVFLGSEVPGYSSIMVTVIFFGSLQLLSIGVLGEYIGRIYVESKRRPVYVIRDVYSAHSQPQAEANRSEE